MSWSVVACDEVAAQPWRNGGGVTRELLAWPTASEWTVRLSVADITRDGPFSAFAGIDRCFAVLTGAGAWLGEPAQRLDRDGAVVTFAGESAPDCRLVNGATRDLNLMVRRGAASGSLRRLPAGEATVLFAAFAGASPSAAQLRGVFSVEGGVLQWATGASITLLPMSLAWCAGPSSSAATFLPANPRTGNFEFHCVARDQGDRTP